MDESWGRSKKMTLFRESVSIMKYALSLFLRLHQYQPNIRANRSVADATRNKHCSFFPPISMSSIREVEPNSTNHTLDTRINLIQFVPRSKHVHYSATKPITPWCQSFIHSSAVSYNGATASSKASSSQTAI